LIRGASGQGKSTLAYRLLLDNFPEKDIFCVAKILNEENVIEICAALKGLSKNRDGEIVTYIDVAPYDTHWLWLCQELYKHESNIKLLITIREDDFCRAPMDYNKISLYELELSLNWSRILSKDYEITFLPFRFYYPFYYFGKKLTVTFIVLAPLFFRRPTASNPFSYQVTVTPPNSRNSRLAISG
jgi:hypothetical protein